MALMSTTTKAAAIMPDAAPTAAAAAAERRPARRQRSSLGWRLLRWTTPVAIIVVWQLLSSTGVIPEVVLPSPLSVLETGFTLASTGELQRHMLVSFQRVVFSLLLGVSSGVVLAVLSAMWRVGDALIDPTVQMFRTVPILALVPLFILWFGIGEESKVLMIALGVFFPVYQNTYAGIRGVDRKLVEVGTMLRLGPWGRIRHIIFPGALPGFLTGLRMALGLAWLLLVISEQVNATSGVGYLMNNARNYMRTDVIVLGIFIYAAAGFITDLIVRITERYALAWRTGLEAK